MRKSPPNSLLLDAYMCNVEMYPIKNWACVIETLAQKFKISRQEINSEKKVTDKLHFLLKEQFIKKWTNDLFDDNRKGNIGNKLRTYRLFKTNVRLESYLLDIKSPKYKKKLTQLRLGSHHLHIETGRHSIPYKEPSDRICTYCPSGNTEDEFHFIMKCSLYSSLRQELFEKVVLLFPIFETYNDHNKFIWLCANLDYSVINLFARFVSDCFDKRLHEKLP